MTLKKVALEIAWAPDIRGSDYTKAAVRRCAMRCGTTRWSRRYGARQV